MDIGVGSFVFSQGVISAIPILKDPVRLLGPTFPKLITTVRKVLPMIVLGVVRVISVKGTDYPVCNFNTSALNFFTTEAYLMYRNMKQNMARTGIFSLQWRYSLSWK